MSDFPVFARHLGAWEGTYTRIDAKTGEVLDRHKSRLSCSRDGSRYHQKNCYTWDDGRVVEYEFDGEFRDGVLYFDTPRLIGESVEADDKTIILTWVYRDEPENGYSEIITLESDDHRCRTWQHFENGDFAKLTVIDERKVE